MPWTIWPALVVLWGVCWMFYPDHSTGTGYDLLPGTPVQEDPFLSIEQDFQSDVDWISQHNFDEFETSMLELHNVDSYRVGYEYEDGDLTANVDSTTVLSRTVPNASGFSKAVVDATELSNKLPASRTEPCSIVEYHPNQAAAITPMPSNAGQLETVNLSAITHHPQPVSTTGGSEGQNRGNNANFGANDEDNQHQVSMLLIGSDQNNTEPTRDARNICLICGKSVSRKEGLERHKLKHKEGQYFCTHPDCARKKAFTRKDNRDQHVRKFHSADPEKHPESHTPQMSRSVFEPRNTLQKLNDLPNNVSPNSQRSQNRKRRRDETHTDGRADVEDVQEKCRRLEIQVAHLQREMDRSDRENERLKIENEVYARIIQTQMKQGK